MTVFNFLEPIVWGAIAFLLLNLVLDGLFRASKAIVDWIKSL